MNKYIIIFVFGLLETLIYTGMLMAVESRQAVLAGFLMTSYMYVYLSILDKCFKDKRSIFMIAIYTISCGLGTWLKIVMG